MTEARPLNVLIVGDYDDDPRLGSAKVAHKLRDELRAMGHRCDAFFTRHLGAAPRGRQVRQLVAPALAYRAVTRAMALHEYDVVDAASAEALWLGVARRLGRLHDAAVICRSNGLEHLNYARMLGDARAGLTRKPWTRRVWYPASRLSQVAAAARTADHLIVLNEADRRHALLRRWKPPDRIHVVPHGVSGRFLTRSADRGSRGAGALFCGTWDHVKGVSYLAAAWGILAESGRRVPLTVLGPGVPADDVLRCFPAAARPLVTVVERVPEEQVIQAYRAHDLLVFPSTYEGFGLVVLEAMSQRLPVIATAVGCAASLVADGRTGALVRERDAVGLAGTVARLMDDPVERQRLAANAWSLVQHMSWRDTATRTVAIYRAALGRAQ